ncbi:hypothetical protein C7N43_38325, partial [Sphingobacteriales bacterium UPWRP_1]
AVQQTVPKNHQKPDEGSNIMFSTSGMIGLLTVGIKALDHEQTQMKATIDELKKTIEAQNAAIELLKKELQSRN